MGDERHARGEIYVVTVDFTPEASDAIDRLAADLDTLADDALEERLAAFPELVESLVNVG